MIYFNEKKYNMCIIYIIYHMYRYITNTFGTYCVYNIVLLNIVDTGVRQSDTEGDESSKKLFEKT